MLAEHVSLSPLGSGERSVAKHLRSTPKYHYNYYLRRALRSGFATNLYKKRPLKGCIPPKETLRGDSLAKRSGGDRSAVLGGC